MTKYKIVRYYRDLQSKRTIKTDLALEEAQAHCKDIETSSITCTTAKGKVRTKKVGAWFDGYLVQQ